jgi:hypothetical protein
LWNTTELDVILTTVATEELTSKAICERVKSWQNESYERWCRRPTFLKALNIILKEWVESQMTNFFKQTGLEDLHYITIVMDMNPYTDQNKLLKAFAEDVSFLNPDDWEMIAPIFLNMDAFKHACPENDEVYDNFKTMYVDGEVFLSSFETRRIRRTTNQCSCDVCQQARQART